MARKPGLRLSDTQILAIFLSTGPQKVVAGEYGIHPSMVSRIRRGWYRPDLTDGVSPVGVMNATLITSAFVGAR